MIRYLTSEQLLANLRLGKAVEQWLMPRVEPDYAVLRWLRIDKEKDGQYSVTCFETFDEGDSDFADVYEFSPLDPDQPFGYISSFESAIEALNFSVSKYGALKDKFVSEGMVQEEYLRYQSGQ